LSNIFAYARELDPVPPADDQVIRCRTLDLQIASGHRPVYDVGRPAKYILKQRAACLRAGHVCMQQGLMSQSHVTCTEREADPNALNRNP